MIQMKTSSPTSGNPTAPSTRFKHRHYPISIEFQQTFSMCRLLSGCRCVLRFLGELLHEEVVRVGGEVRHSRGAQPTGATTDGAGQPQAARESQEGTQRASQSECRLLQ